MPACHRLIMDIHTLMQDSALRQRELGVFGGSFQYPCSGDGQGGVVANDQTQTYPCCLGADEEGQVMNKSGTGMTPAGLMIIGVRKSALPDGFRFLDYSSGGPGTYLLLTDADGNVTPQAIASHGVKDARISWVLTLHNPNAGA